MKRKIGFLCEKCNYLIKKNHDKCVCGNLEVFHKPPLTYVVVTDDFNSVELYDIYLNDDGSVVKMLRNIYKEAGANLQYKNLFHYKKEEDGLET